MTEIATSPVQLAALAAVLAVASWTDWSAHRIPNWLVLSGALMGIVSGALTSGGPGLATALAGAIAGLALLLPMYLVRAMAAGDVKLMAVVGAFLGPRDLLGAALFIFLIGGLYAVAAAAGRGVLRQMLANVWRIVAGSAVAVAAGHLPVATIGKPSARLPYALAIGSGTLAFLVWQQAQG